MEAEKLLKFSLEEIKLATNNFSIGKARHGFWSVYTGKLGVSDQQRIVAVRRLDREHRLGDRQFLMEIQMLLFYKHENLISLVGFCKEGEENIMVYEHAKHGSLDWHLSNDRLSWTQRLKISLGAARGFSYLHNGLEPQHRVLHRDIRSSNILLDENWEAKISDFELSSIDPFHLTDACGTFVYVDPQYGKTLILTKESDVYSFGVVLFEILCGRPALNNTHQKKKNTHQYNHRSLALLVEQNRLDEIIFHGIKSEMVVESLNVYTMVAFQCLKENRIERPTMAMIVERLETALELQVNSKLARFIRIGTWGRHIGDTLNNWSFKVKPDHRLQKITIDHGDDVIYSLMFTCQHEGVSHTSSKVGGIAGGQTLSEVMLDSDEDIVGIKGSIGNRDGHTVISSLSFETNKKRIHGPFGGASASAFSIPWDNGSLAGFYGIAGYYIDSIGVHVKTYEKIIRVGTWGRSDPGVPTNVWSFQLEKNHHLEKITIDHGDLIYSLMFSTQYQGLTNSSNRFGGWNGGDKVSEVKFDRDEEIIAISGTVALSRGDDPGNTVIASISFVTNKKRYGPFGSMRGKSFTVPWDDGSFAGFYGLCGWYIDSIGVYLKAT
ncbi:hypothetical protein R6Q59_007482 [Mikania micrantha]